MDKKGSEPDDSINIKGSLQSEYSYIYLRFEGKVYTKLSPRIFFTYNFNKSFIFYGHKHLYNKILFLKGSF
jgi:hypothetical protein